MTSQDLAQKLTRIGIVCQASLDFHLQLSDVSLTTERSVAVVVSHRGRTAEAVEVAGAAKAHGATIIAITNVPGLPLGKLADIVLNTAASEGRFRAGATTSRIAQLAVVDFLFVRVVQTRFAEANAALAVTRDTLWAHGLRWEPQSGDDAEDET